MRKALLIATLAALCGAAKGQFRPLTAHHPAATDSHSRLATAAPTAGPVLDATGLGGPLPLDRGWRVGITADPDAASPDFDDSGWAVRDAAPMIQPVPEGPQAPNHGHGHGPDQGRGPDSGPDSGVHVQVGPVEGDHHDRSVWFRLHIRLPEHHRPVALLIDLPVSRATAMEIGSVETSIRVYANGQLIHPQGPHGTAPGHYQQITRIYDLNVPDGQTALTLALQMPFIPFDSGSYTGFFASRQLLLGYPSDLANRLLVWNDRTLFERIPRLAYSALLLVLACFLFALYFAQRGHNEYLWLALHELVWAPAGFVELAGSTARLDSLWYAALVLQLMLASAYLFFEFLISFLALKRRWYTLALRYSAPVLAGVGPTMLLVGHSNAIGVVLLLVFLGSTLWMLGWLVFMFTTLIAATIRRNFEAGLLLVPLVLNLLGSIESTVTAGLNQVSAHPERAPWTIFAGPIPIHLATIADFTGVLAILIIIFLRYLHIQRDQQHAASEMAAARSVQELLIPQEKVATPGFEVDSVYNPAAEVGGDFFYVQTMDDDGVLVVVGDVAGKGLKAAMTVSMLMGALRRSTDRSPARVLSALNRVLIGSDSFTTCQAAWFDAGGGLVMASAGHLPPYLNSQEISLPGSLPLGAVAEVGYEELNLYLHPGDRVLFYSDGVVEARKPSGELFGFDRVHNVSNQSAFFIADMARDFGQNDDITVLTVRRLDQPARADQPAAAA